MADRGRGRATGPGRGGPIYGGGQGLVAVVNDPRADSNRSWWGFSRPDLSWSEPPPPLDPLCYPNFKLRDLDHYLRVVRGAHQQFLRDRASLLDNVNRYMMLGIPGDDSDDEEEQAGVSHASSSSTLTQIGAGRGAGGLSAPGGPSAPGAPSTSGRMPAGRPRGQGDGLAQALLRVPANFFAEDFTVEGSGLLQNAGGLEELHASIDELSGFLDEVEAALMREVAQRSKSVFRAAGEMSTLHRQLCRLLATVRGLRESLGRLDEATYNGACSVVALTRRKNNVQATLELLQGVQEVVAARAALQMLLEGQDYAGALDLLEVVVHSMEANHALGVTAFSEALPQMRETRELLESLLACEFVGLAHFSQASRVMDTSISRCAAAAAHAAGGSSTPSTPFSNGGGTFGGGGLDPAAESAQREQLHDKLLPIVLALLRVDKLSGAMHQLRDNATTSIKALILEVQERMLGQYGPLYTQVQQYQQYNSPPPQLPPIYQSQGSGRGLEPPPGVPSSSMGPSVPTSGSRSSDTELAGRRSAGGTDADGGSTGAWALQALQHDGFMQLLSVVAEVVGAALTHTSLLASIIKDDIMVAAKVPERSMSQVSRDAAAVTQSLADVAAQRWARLVSARTSATPRLKLYEFQALVDACEAFASLLEPASSRAAQQVRGAAHQQCKQFLDALHTRNKTQLQTLLEAEQWSAADVPPTFQDMVSRLMSRADAATNPTAARNAAAPGSWQGAERAGSSGRGDAGSTGGGSTAAASQAGSTVSSTGGKPPVGGLLLHGKRFPLVSTTLMLLKLLDEYMSLADTSPMYRIEIGHHACDLIRTFNEQACQLVLGAGAVRTAGLRSISAKHLALSCESCYMMSQLVPTLRAVFLAAGPIAGGHTGSARGAGGHSHSGHAPQLEPKKHMLLVEIDKLAQDLTVHTSQIHSKLVDIMQDRLVAAARQITGEAMEWAATPLLLGPPPATAVTGSSGGGATAATVATQALPSGFEPAAALRSLSKQLSTLQGVLVPLLQPEEVGYIFGRVASLFSETLAVTLDAMNPPPSAAATVATAAAGQAVQPAGAMVGAVAWEERRRLNTLYALQCLQALPLERAQATTYLSRLSTFYTKHYGPITAASYRPPATAALPAPAVVLPAADSGALSSSTLSPVASVSPSGPQFQGQGQQPLGTSLRENGSAASQAPPSVSAAHGPPTTAAATTQQLPTDVLVQAGQLQAVQVQAADPQSSPVAEGNTAHHDSADARGLTGGQQQAQQAQGDRQEQTGVAQAEDMAAGQLGQSSREAGLQASVHGAAGADTACTDPAAGSEPAGAATGGSMEVGSTAAGEEDMSACDAADAAATSEPPVTTAASLASDTPGGASPAQDAMPLLLEPSASQPDGASVGAPAPHEAATAAHESATAAHEPATDAPASLSSVAGSQGEELLQADATHPGSRAPQMSDVDLLGEDVTPVSQPEPPLELSQPPLSQPGTLPQLDVLSQPGNEPTSSHMEEASVQGAHQVHQTPSMTQQLQGGMLQEQDGSQQADAPALDMSQAGSQLEGPAPSQLAAPDMAPGPEAGGLQLEGLEGSSEGAADGTGAGWDGMGNGELLGLEGCSGRPQGGPEIGAPAEGWEEGAAVLPVQLPEQHGTSDVPAGHAQSEGLGADAQHVHVAAEPESQTAGGAEQPVQMIAAQLYEGDLPASPSFRHPLA